MRSALRTTLLFAFLFCTLLAPSHILAATDAESFVKTSGTKFTLNGKEFRFVGFNLFDAAATDRYKCAWWPKMSDDELDAAFAAMKNESGTTVVRFWAFQKYTNGAQDWSGVDRVIRLAKKHGLKVIPVIENGQEHCTGNTSLKKYQYNDDTWYTEGYKRVFGSDRLSYRDYVKEIVTKYKDEPAILGWMMMNEADTSKRDAQDQSVLVNFARDIADLISSIDSNHLITVGTQSNGASGASGKDFVAVYGLPQIDFTEAHDWGFWSGNETDPLPGSSDGKTLPSVSSPDCVKTYQAKVACQIANSVQVLKKPFVMGEAGIKAQDSAASRQLRAEAMEKKMKAAFDNGVAGYLIWQWNTTIDEEHYDVLQKHNDPLLGKMKTFADTFSQPGEETSSCPQADFNGDKKVDSSDFNLLKSNFFKSTAPTKFDLKQDGKIDIQDFFKFVKDLGKSC